jgi:parallel beta-helix repeat protein
MFNYLYSVKTQEVFKSFVSTNSAFWSGNSNPTNTTTSRVEVYAYNTTEILATFENITFDENGTFNKYRILLTELNSTEDTFDLVSVGDVEYDFVVDPYIDTGALTQNVNDCGNLTTENAVYTLTQDVNSTGTCFNIQANNITLDCNGYEINYSSDGGNYEYGVHSSGYDFTTVKNCVITEGLSAGDYDYGIYFEDADNGTIENNTITTSGSSGYGTYLRESSNNNLNNNTITTSGTYGYGTRLRSSSNNSLTNNKVNSSQSNSYVLYGTTSLYYNNSIDSSNLAEGKPVNYTYNADNLVFNNVDFTQYGQVIFAYSRGINITNSNFSDDSLNLFYTSNSLIQNNNINTSKGYGIYLYQNAVGNNLNNNTINTSGSHGYGTYLYSIFLYQ